MPIIRAYIILTNTTISFPDEVQDHTTSVPTTLDIGIHNTSFSIDKANIISRIYDGLNHTVKFAQSILSQKNSADTTTIPVTLYTVDFASTSSNFSDKFTSAKPVDYLVAGTEGLAWVVHFCFILSLKRGRDPNPRGPLLIRTLIFLLTVVSVLLLRSHINNKSKDDVLPNLSLGFSISVVTLLIFYIVTLIPSSKSRTEDARTSSRNTVVSLASIT